MIDNVNKDVVKITIGNGTYECEESAVSIDISDEVAMTKLVCPFRMDVFCNNPQKGFKIKPDSDADHSSIFIWIFIELGLVGFCVLMNQCTSCFKSSDDD
jgi:hypothetical protein